MSNNPTSANVRFQPFRWIHCSLTKEARKLNAKQSVNSNWRLPDLETPACSQGKYLNVMSLGTGSGWCGQRFDYFYHLLNRFAALSPARIGTLLVSVHINLCVTAAEELWTSQTGTAGTSTSPLLSPCTHPGERRCPDSNGCTILGQLQQRTRDHLHHTCHLSTVDCPPLCGRKTITPPLCSLSICQRVIKKVRRAAGTDLDVWGWGRRTTRSTDALEQVRGSMTQTFIHKEQIHQETATKTQLRQAPQIITAP